MRVPLDRMIACVVATSVLASMAGCAGAADRKLATAVLKPAPAVTSEVSTALPDGRESVYSLVNTGTIADADALLRDVWNIPRYRPVTLPGGPSWTEDPYKQKYWRFYFYSLRATSSLLWAYYHTGRSDYRDKLLEILRSYVEHDAARNAREVHGMDDPHAMSYRAMVLVNTYAKLNRSGDLPADLRPGLLQSIRKIANQLSDPRNFQGTYNHGFTEAIALLLAGENFPDLKGSAGWASLARQRIAGLLDFAVDSDGVEKEKSPFYHFYVFDIMLQTEQWAEHNDIELPRRFSARIDEMTRYATEVIYPNGHIPLKGASLELRPARSISRYGDVIKKFPEFAFALTAGESGRPPSKRAAIFPVSGQSILRSPVDPQQPYTDNTQLLMDVGPLVSDHSHEEALAFTYYSHGRELLPDSGLNTYAFGTARDFFHGTSAHNTITVDGRDQDGGPVRAGLTTTGPTWAYQSGVAEVYRGVTHRRSVVLLARDVVLVVDNVTSNRSHEYEQLWHMFEGARVLADSGKAQAFNEFDNPALTIVQSSTETESTLRSHYGEKSPMQGWISTKYGEARPNHVLGYVKKGSTAQYFTLITSGQYAGQTATVSGTGGAGDLTADVCVGSFAAHVQIGKQAAAGEHVSVTEHEGCRDGA
jgi:hypothetical protein